jgi:hypothetical protein
MDCKPAGCGVPLFSLAMFALAAASNAVMDTLQFRYERSVFARWESCRQWLDPQVSWRNKWKNGDPQQGEAFPLSSTALVAVTDAWHLAKSVMLFSLAVAIVAPFTRLIRLRWPAWVLVVLGMKLVFGLVFELLFAGILLRS